MTAGPAALGRFLAGLAPRANPPADPWDLIARAVAGANRPRRPGLARARELAAPPRRRAPWTRLVEGGAVPWEWASDPAHGFVASRGYVCGVFVGFDGDYARILIGRVMEKHILRPDVSPLLKQGDLVINAGSYYEPAVLDAPDDDQLAVALAADVEGAMRAEEYAREAAARLAFWGAGPVSRVAWQRLEYQEEFAPTMQETVMAELSQDLWDAHPFSSGEESAAARRLAGLVGDDGDNVRGLGPIRGLAMDHIRWGKMVETTRYTLRGGGAFYHQLQNPFDPLLELVALGYSAGSPEGHTMRVFTPGLGDDEGV